MLHCTLHLYCIGTWSIADTIEVASSGLRRTRRTRGSWASPPNTEMENLNVRKYHHSSQSVLYISTVWRIELGFRERQNTFVDWENMVLCVVCSVGSGLQHCIDNYKKMCAFVCQPTQECGRFLRSSVWLVCATITGALWGCLVSLQVG